MPKTSPLAKRVLFFALLTFFIGVVSVKPYGNTIITHEIDFEYIFMLYFFAINQTLGIVHEAGHGICNILPCPDIIAVANGTIFQLAFPLGVAYYYLKKEGSRTIYYTGLFFFAISLKYTAWYMADARKNGLYVSAEDSFLGVDGVHDFYFIFDFMGLLSFDTILGAIAGIIATVVLMYSLFQIGIEAFMSKS